MANDVAELVLAAFNTEAHPSVRYQAEQLLKAIATDVLQQRCPACSRVETRDSITVRSSIDIANPGGPYLADTVSTEYVVCSCGHTWVKDA